MNKNRKKKWSSAYLCLLLTVTSLLLVSCGSALSSGGTADKASAQASEESYSAPMMAAGESADTTEEAAVEEAYEVNAAEWDGEDEISDELTAAEASEDGGGDYSNLEKIVYSCSADIQTLEYEKSVKDLKAAVKKAGGIIQQETESDDNYSWYYDSSGGTSGSYNRNLYLTVRIPSDQYESFINSLDAYGKVLNRTQTADNISKAYNDKQTYIASLETEQKRLLEMMDQAETIEDMMAVEERLTEVQRQLNQYKTELESMNMDLAYSTVTLSLQEVRKIENSPTPADSFGTRIKKAFAGAWEAFAEFCQDFVIGLIYLIPAILIIALIVGVILFATRKKRRARKEKKRAEREMIEDLKRRAEQEREKQQ